MDRFSDSSSTAAGFSSFGFGVCARISSLIVVWLVA